MKTYFTVDSFPGQRFLGKIRQIRNAATTVQNVVTYDAVIDVDNADLRLRPGMTANVTVVYAERRDALAVPNAALRFRPPPSLAGSAATEAPHRRTGGDGAGDGHAESQPRGDGQGQGTATAGPRRRHTAAPRRRSARGAVRSGCCAAERRRRSRCPSTPGSPTARNTEIVDGDLQRGRRGGGRL